jgi:hypothetical protein
MPHDGDTNDVWQHFEALVAALRRIFGTFALRFACAHQPCIAT